MILFAEPHSKQNRRDRHRVVNTFNVQYNALLMQELCVHAAHTLHCVSATNVLALAGDTCSPLPKVLFHCGL